MGYLFIWVWTLTPTIGKVRRTYPRTRREFKPETCYKQTEKVPHFKFCKLPSYFLSLPPSLYLIPPINDFLGNLALQDICMISLLHFPSKLEMNQFCEKISTCLIGTKQWLTTRIASRYNWSWCSSSLINFAFLKEMGSFFPFHSAIYELHL